MKLSNREKAAFLLGMVNAYAISNWPNHFGKPDRDKWIQHGVWALQALTGGCYNPFDAFAVTGLADEALEASELKKYKED